MGGEREREAEVPAAAPERPAERSEPETAPAADLAPLLRPAAGAEGLPLSTEQVLALQRDGGNRAVTAYLSALADVEASRAPTLAAFATLPPSTPIERLSSAHSLRHAFDGLDEETAAALRVAHAALNDPVRLTDEVLRIRAHAAGLALRGVAEPFRAALEVHGKEGPSTGVVTVELDLADVPQAYLAGLLDLAARRSGGPVVVLPGDLSLDSFEFLDFVGEGLPFVDVSAIVTTESSHGATTHLLQDLVVDGALREAGCAMNVWQLRQRMVAAPGAYDWARWDEVFDVNGVAVLNNPNALQKVLRIVLHGDPDGVLATVDPTLRETAGPGQ
ncbi:hypothetical protein [Virgisporangium aliadipatigenens]|uniref:hypothetical protein n=1 Tax=Virgisporangium aliadipatigenens TaxID=741659 RepID=UPI0019436438|nr:hypothetical protein [Virgisporangium aliadipatigenens]